MFKVQRKVKSAVRRLKAINRIGIGAVGNMFAKAGGAGGQPADGATGAQASNTVAAAFGKGMSVTTAPHGNALTTPASVTPHPLDVEPDSSDDDDFEGGLLERVVVKQPERGGTSSA